MSTRTSFDLHADHCRVADVHVATSRATGTADIRVKGFALLGEGRLSPTLVPEVARLRQEHLFSRDAWVTIWGLRSIHQFLRLPPASNGDLEALAVREARRELSALEAEAGRPSVALMIGAEVQVGAHRRREVSLTAAPEGEITRHIKPLVDAGFDVRGVCTPAMALTAVARQYPRTTSGTISVYVALEPNAMCVAIVRDGALLFSREVPWGFADTDEPIEERLAAELRRSMLFFRQSFRTAVERVVLCGGMANLRSLTSPLTAALKLPVETLDSLTGIDAESVPEPADGFRAAVAALWPAIAVAAETGPRPNLLPAGVRVTREKRAELVRIAAAFIAGVMTIAIWYFLTGSARDSRMFEVARLERQVAALEPEAARISALRSSAQSAVLQQAALDAFESQGPRLARVLELLSQATPADVNLNEIDAQAQGPHWRAVLSGIALTPDAASGQGEVKLFLQRVAVSPYIASPAQAPSFRVVSGSGTPPGEERDAMPIPDGMTGVEFRARFDIPK